MGKPLQPRPGRAILNSSPDRSFLRAEGQGWLKRRSPF